MSSNNVNLVFYADSYHPIQAGSIDGTDILPHDNAVYRALLCSSAGLYDPFGDPKVVGDPYCTLFVGRLSDQTDEETLKKAMEKYGKVKNLRLVRHIVTGASRRYAFVEYETERDTYRAYKDAHHTYIDDSEVIVDYNRQRLMPGWIPRRLGGGLGGKKESGQLRFGGRERPFRAPLRPIPHDDLKRLGIPAPPEGRYMSRFQIPSPPRRSGTKVEREDSPAVHRRSEEREDDLRERKRHISREESPLRHKRSSRSSDRHKSREEPSSRHKRYRDERYDDKEHSRSKQRSPRDTDESGPQSKRHKYHSEHSHRHRRSSTVHESSPRRRRERSMSREYSP